MYGQNLGVRPDAPGELIFTKFCVRVLAPDVFLSFEFQKDRMKNVGAVGSKFPLSYSKGTSLIQLLVATVSLNEIPNMHSGVKQIKSMTHYERCALFALIEFRHSRNA